MAIGELERKSEEKRNLGGSKMGLQARTAIPTQDVAYGSPRLDCPSRLSLLKSRGIPNHEYTSPDWLVFKRERECFSKKKKKESPDWSTNAPKRRLTPGSAQVFFLFRTGFLSACKLHSLPKQNERICSLPLKSISMC